MPLAVSVCPAVTVWCTSMTTSSETVGRPSEVCYRYSLYLRISALNHAELAEYLGRVVVDDCGDTHARLPQRSSHFGNRVRSIHRELSQEEPYRRHVRVPE
ncbi:hypothetical protein TNCV_133971 [Trichonephila clavipes]|nr:hypothetical protein TNCV_133971 [Trichonephila clavipes]